MSMGPAMDPSQQTAAPEAPAGVAGLDGLDGASLPEAARAAWDDVRGAVSERAKLLTLELRLAGMTLVQLVIYAVIVAVLVISAWLGLMVGLVVTFVNVGLHWALALGLGIVVNLGVAAWLLSVMNRLVERVGLPASLRQLEGNKSAPAN